VIERPAASAAFDPAYFSELAQVEDRHFWFRARNRLIAGLVPRVVRDLPLGYRVLEVGCGNGNVLRVLSQCCPGGLTIGMDFFAEGLRLARLRSGCPLVQGDARRPPFGRRFHLIGMFDVLEHIADDRQMLKDVRALLEPGGVLIVTVPGRRALWSYFDEASQHYRRYEQAELLEKLKEFGFEVQHLSPFMCSIFLPLWMIRRLRKQAGGDPKEDPAALARSEFRILPVINEVLTAALWIEAIWVSRGHRLPFGTSLLAVARRPLHGE
jgi:SAM-dependent methyltransferase